VPAAPEDEFPKHGFQIVAFVCQLILAARRPILIFAAPDQAFTFEAGEPADFTPAQPASHADVLEAFEASIATTTELLAGLDEAAAGAPWRMTLGGRGLFVVARLDVMRTLAFNHWYHHRGQLLVYLRLLDVPVPVVYGRSFDENRSRRRERSVLQFLKRAPTIRIGRPQ
jgi:uncharacterized damage-inducible protein DinB